MKNSLQRTEEVPSSPFLNFSGWAILLVALVALAACRDTALDPIKQPGPIGGLPGDSTGTKPGKPNGDSTNTNPGKPTGQLPGDSTGTKPGGPVSVFKSLKISYSAADFQEIQFDAQGIPVHYTSQYVNNQGTGGIQRWVYQFQYGADQRLSRVDRGAGGYIQYTYEGNQVVRTEEFSSAGERLNVHVYHYSAANQLLQVDTENRINGLRESRQTYQYDVRGNLSKFTESVKNTQGEYALETTTSYEDYDSQKHVENLLTAFPFLPTVTFRVNNYHTKIVRYKDGREISRETFDYAYDNQGNPTQRSRKGAGGTLTATYSY